MFRRLISTSSTLLFRKFSEKLPPEGFEKFFKKPSASSADPFKNHPNLPPDPSKSLNNKTEKDPVPEAEESKAKPSQPKEKEAKDTTDSKPSEEPPKPSKSSSSDKKEEDKKSKSSESKKSGSSNNNNNNNRDDTFVLMALLSAYLVMSALPKSDSPARSPSYSNFGQLMAEISSGNVRYITIKTPKKNSKDSQAVVVAQDSNYKDIMTTQVPDVSSFISMIENKSPSDPNLGPIKITFQESQEQVEKWDEVSSPFTLSNIILFGCLYILFQIIRKPMSKSQGSNTFKDIFGMGKANFKVYGTDKKVNVTFKDVAGQKEAKREISEFVEFLKNPEKYAKLGARMPRGALLVGPPGTGKTLLAKASAGEAGVPFFATSGSEFVEMFVGVGASRVRELFKQAREKAPSIIFIDEIDAVGRKRDDSRFKNDERDSTLNQLLVEMDGFQTDTFVVVMAATNRQDTLDNALLRPGRFDRIVEVSLPDIEGREQILKVHLAPIKLASDFDIDACAKRMAALTPGFSGADLSQVCNEAAILAAREGKESVERVDFERASEKVMLGVESNKRLTPKEKKIVSYHEAGHAVAGWFLEGADPVIKVSILPRSKGALGFAQNLPKETMLLNEQEFKDKICMILGGRVSELLFFGSVTNGASDDLKKATQLAQALTENFGMSKNAGLVSYSLNERYYSENTKDLLDREVKKVIDECLERTKELLDGKKELIVNLAEKLLQSERLTHKDLVEILGPRPFEESDEYKRYILEQKMDDN